MHVYDSYGHNEHNIDSLVKESTNPVIIHPILQIFYLPMVDVNMYSLHVLMSTPGVGG